MASKFTLAVLLLAAALTTAQLAPAVAAGPPYCLNTLQDLLTCTAFIFGDEKPTPVCCAAYSSIFASAPLCLCYVADGEFGREFVSGGINVTRALDIPALCGQPQPPIEVCNIPGIALPPFKAPSPSSPAPARPPSGAGQAPAAAPSQLSSDGGRASSPALPIVLVSGMVYGILSSLLST